jgi:hippurate hydrolase
MLAGAARLLSERVESLHGDVVFMFQPGEEGYDGAGAMISEGILDAAGVRPVAAYGLHVTTKVPHGAFSTRPGGMLAASDRVLVEVRGAGGHGSAPHSARDPIPAACEIVVALQTMMTRRLNPFDPAVLTVGTFHAGTAANIIPDSAWFEATVRTFTPTTQATIEAEVTRVAQAVAAAHGLEADVAYTRGYPATITDPDETEFAVATIADLYGAGRFVPMETPVAGAEDFSRVLQQVPGSFVLLGAAPADVDIEQAPYNHSPLAEFDDAVMGDGAALLAELAARRLAAGAA